MAMFTKENQPQGTDAKQSGPAGEGALSIIAAGMTVTGDIDSNGVVKIEGRVEGTVRSARQVLVGRQGSVKGDIETREAIIGGRVDGGVKAIERIEVQGTAYVAGDVHTKSIVVLEGGRLNGSVRMEEGAAPGGKSGDAKGADFKAPPVAMVR